MAIYIFALVLIRNFLTSACNILLGLQLAATLQIHLTQNIYIKSLYSIDSKTKIKNKYWRIFCLKHGFRLARNIMISLIASTYFVTFLHTIRWSYLQVCAGDLKSILLSILIFFFLPKFSRRLLLVCGRSTLCHILPSLAMPRFSCSQ